MQAVVIAACKGSHKSDSGHEGRLITSGCEKYSDRQVLVGFGKLLLLFDDAMIRKLDVRATGEVSPKQRGVGKHRIERKQPAKRVPPENASRGVRTVVRFDERNQLGLQEAQEFRTLSRPLCVARYRRVVYRPQRIVVGALTGIGNTNNQYVRHHPVVQQTPDHRIEQLDRKSVV